MNRITEYFCGPYLPKSLLGRTTVHLVPAEPFSTALCGAGKGASLWDRYLEETYDYKFCPKCLKIKDERAEKRFEAWLNKEQE